MGNTIISSLLFQPPTPANELDYFGSVATSTAAAVTSPRSAHNDSSNQAVHKSKGHFVRGGGSHSSRQQPSQPSQQQQVVTSNNNSNEPTLHYIWLVSPTHPLPIPALHIQHSTSLRPSNTPSTNRYTLLYSHGNAEDIGLLAKFLTDISKLLQVDILVYDYTGYGVSVDRRAVLRFYAVWGGRLEEWRRWRRSQSRSRNGVGVNDGEMRQDEGKNNGVRYSMDVFMAPMVFAKTTADAASSGKETSSSASPSTSALNLPDNVYVCGDELDFIEDDATTIATASDNDHQYHHQRTTSSSGRSRRSSATTSSEPRDNSLLDIDDDYDNDDYGDYDDDMPSITATCYENSTMHGGDDYDDDTEDEVSLFTCGASCNEAVEHSSIVEGLEEEEYEEDDNMRDDPTSEFSASSSYRHHHSSQASSPRSISGGSTTTATVMSSSSQRRNSSQRRRGRRGHPNRQISIRAPLTPKQRRRALLRKHKWTMPSPSEEQCYGDILLAYNYLLQIQEVPAKHVLLYGKSVGSGPTCWLAQRTCQSSSVGSSSKDVAYDASGGGGGGMMYEDVRDDGDVDYRDERVGGGGAASVGVGGRSGVGGNNKSGLVGRSCDDDDAPGGVILHSPFLSVIRVVLDMGFTTVGDLFPNIDRVKDFTCPTYIIHGTQDEIVPYYHGQGLFNGLSDTSKAVPFWANGAGHNNIEMEMPTAYIKRLMQFVRQCDRLNYPAGELLRTRAFSSGSHGSAKQQRGGSSAHSQQELDSALHLPNNHHRKHTHTRQMMSSVSKQRKKKGHSNSPTMVVNTVNTTTPKRRQGGGGGRSRRNSNNSISMEQQQVMHHHHGKYHHHQQPQQQYQQQQQHNHHQSAGRDQYPSVVTNLSTDAAMCGIHEPSVESKYYTQYLQQQQQQQQSSYY